MSNTTWHTFATLEEAEGRHKDFVANPVCYLTWDIQKNEDGTYSFKTKYYNPD